MKTQEQKPIEVFPDATGRIRSQEQSEYELDFDIDLDLNFDLGTEIGKIDIATGAPDRTSKVPDLEQLAPEDRSDAIIEMMGSPRTIKRAHGLASTHALGCARDLVAKVKPGEQCRVICPGTFVFGDLITFVAELAPGSWMLTVATLSIGESNTDSLEAAFKGGHLSAFRLIVSDYFYNNNLHGEWRSLVTALPRDKCQYAVAGVHAKVAFLENDKGENWIFEGSANMRSCRNIEQITVSRDDTEGLRFHSLWTGRIFEKFELDGRIKMANARVWNAIRG
jgi:hypothetical protein